MDSTYSIELPRGLRTTTYELKTLFYQQVQSNPLDQMNLQLAGRPVLGDDESLEANGVTDGATLHVSNKIRGGGGGGQAGGSRGWLACLMPSRHEFEEPDETEDPTCANAFFSAFAPAEIRPDETDFILQVHGYTRDYLVEPQGMAEVGKKGPLRLRNGLDISIQLELGASFIHDGRPDSFIWDAVHGIANFQVACRRQAVHKAHVCKAFIAVAGTRSTLPFYLNVVEGSPPASPVTSVELAGGDLTVAASAPTALFKTCIDREFVQKEIRWAVQYKPAAGQHNVLTVFEEDRRRQAHFDMSAARAKYAHGEWGFLLEIDAVTYRRNREEAQAMLRIIEEKMVRASRAPARQPLNAPGKWDFFLSHGQAAAGEQVKVLCLLLRDRGHTVWYDNEMTDCSTAAMEEGVKHAANFLLFLSGDPDVYSPLAHSTGLRLDPDASSDSDGSIEVSSIDHVAARLGGAE